MRRHEQTHLRAILRARAALDVAGLLQSDERGLHGHLVAHPGARGDLTRRKLDAPEARPRESVIDLHDEFGRRVRAFDEVVLRALVGVVEEQEADRLSAVAASAAYLLVVGFNRAGQVEVHDETYVGLVNAHAEGVRGDDHLRAARHEVVLRAHALLVRHPRVVADDGEPRVPELLRDLLDGLARRGIDDAGLAGVLRGELAYARELLALALRVGDADGEVRAVEAADEGARVGQIQLFDDVGADVGRGRGRQGDGLRAANGFAEGAQAQVVGPKVVAPLRDAVRLVHGEERDLSAAQGLDEVRAAEAFGRDVEELETPLAHARDPLLLLLEVERAVDEGRRQPARVERVHLVFHQRDERGDDDRHALEHERGQLEAEGFAAARRHHDHRVVAFQYRAYYLALALAEILEPEVLPQRHDRGFHLKTHRLAAFSMKREKAQL